MTDHNKAEISALMDGELDEMAVKRLLQDRTLGQTWHRYHIISDVIQNRTPLNTDIQLTLRISESIRNEPTLLVPISRQMPAWLKPVSGIAVAASVAALAILGVQQYRPAAISVQIPAVTSVSNQGVDPAPVERTGGLQPVIAGLPNPGPAPQDVIPGQAYTRKVNNVQISRYILNHNEYQSNAGVHGVTPHVRLVATDGR